MKTYKEFMTEDIINEVDVPDAIKKEMMKALRGPRLGKGLYAVSDKVNNWLLKNFTKRPGGIQFSFGDATFNKLINRWFMGA